MNNFKIGQVKFQKNSKKVIFIAEAAVEHLGSLNVAKQMALAAKDSGADIIKYQMHIPDEEMLKNKIKFWGGSLDDILEKYNLSIEDHIELIKFCKKIGIQYLCTPFSPMAAKVLNKIGVAGFKTGSGEMMNIPLLDEIIKTGKPLILSTGMSTHSEIKYVADYLMNTKIKFLIMNCTSVYPCPPNLVNLKLIETYSKKFDIMVGHSDHTSSIWTSLGAVACGAKVIEKHFTLNKKLCGPDYEVSLEPDEFKQMVNASKVISKALGNKKVIHQKEKKVRKWANHSIVSKKKINKGEKLSLKNVTVKRPSGGIPAFKLTNVIGLKSVKTIKKNSQIFSKDLKFEK